MCTHVPPVIKSTLDAMGEWETVTWNVSDLVAAGLDLTTVNTGLVVIPAIGDQGGVVYRLDNVRWYIPGEDTGGTPPPALEDKVLEAGVAQSPFVISAYDEQIGYGTCPGAPGTAHLWVGKLYRMKTAVMSSR